MFEEVEVEVDKFLIGGVSILSPAMSTLFAFTFPFFDREGKA